MERAVSGLQAEWTESVSCEAVEDFRIGSVTEADVTADLKLVLEDIFKCWAAEGAKRSLWMSY